MSNTLMDAGCDAISCTTLTGGESHEILTALFSEQFRLERERGMDVHTISPSGFAGDQCGRVFSGSLGDRILYQARGDLAKQAADRLRSCRESPHITRLDWQATFRAPITEREACHRYSGFINRATARGLPQSKGRGVVYTSRDLANSYNLVSNSRQSFWRTYNKHRESPGDYPPNTWRHEWEIKGKRAVNSWHQFRLAGSQADYAVAVLRGFLLKCGLDEPCLREQEPILVIHGKHKSDTQRRLDWMESTVAAVVGKLLGDGVSMTEIVSLLTKANGVKGWYFERGTLETRSSEN